ncbi:MAG: ABC transporter permease [Bacteroidales bacterium]|nr:ABC transporter permease [Bacteroidales bacterium]
MIKILKQAKESLIFALNSVIVNKLRTFLSLLGITIGIFSIITVFTVIDSLENNIRSSIASLGENVVYVQKWPWSMGGEYPWWKYLRRPVPKQEEEELLRKKLSLSEAISFMAGTNKTIKYESKSFENTSVLGVASDYEKIRSFEIKRGRFISPTEYHTGKNVAVIGYKLSIDLFGTKSPIDKTIKISGRKVKVIGVFEKEGESAIGEDSLDETIIVPVNYIKSIVNLRNIDPLIMVKAKEGIATDDLIDEIRGALRSIRRLKPKEEDNFALNQISLLSEGLNNIFGTINIAGWIIGGFSLLVGGFGIANIMFVSVRERTNLIGIQKALGAKNYFILLQFLYESVLLSIIGGSIGLLLIFILTTIVSATGSFNISLTVSNIVLGLTISSVIGIISGFSPAFKASRLNPVEAISANV